VLPMLRMEGIFVDVFVYEDIVIVADARMSSVIGAWGFRRECVCPAHAKQ